MASLYQISSDILDLFNTIESQDGEVTDEQYDALTIKENELKEKLCAYVEAIKEFQNDAEFCKIEKKSINDKQNVYKNRVERLKNAALKAVLEFGKQGKTNKYIEIPKYRLFTKSTKSVEIDNKRVRIFMAEFERYIRELVGQGLLYSGDDIDLQGFLDCINANVRAEQGDDFEPYTLNDLIGMRINISQIQSVYELLKSGLALTLYGQEPTHTTMEEATRSEDWKSIIDLTEKTDKPKPTMAKVVINQSLQIK